MSFFYQSMRATPMRRLHLESRLRRDPSVCAGAAPTAASGWRSAVGRRAHGVRVFPRSCRAAAEEAGQSMSNNDTRTGEAWRAEWYNWWWAAGNAEALDVLMRMPEADANTRDDRGQTKLMVAADAGDAAMVATLLACGADVNRSSRKGTTAVIFAVWRSDPATLQLLVDAGADLTVRDSQFGYTLPMWAVQNKDMKILAILLAGGADVRAKDTLGMDVMKLAKQLNFTEACAMLQQALDQTPLSDDP